MEAIANNVYIEDRYPGRDPGRDQPAARIDPDRRAALAGRWTFMARLH